MHRRPRPSASAVQTTAADLELAAFVADFYADPLGFVLACYPWGVPGTSLADQDGPDAWQRDELERIGREVKERGFNGVDAVSPIRGVVSSGHGVGKTTIVAWIVAWIMSTRPHCRGTVTANTFTQLETKTWAAIQTWTKMCLTARWFVIGAQRLYHRSYKDSWFCAPQSSQETNSEAFAGQHAANSTSFYIIDEASAIADVIFDVAEGGLTDGEPMIFLFGNPTRSHGRFHEACFGKARDRWNPTIVDSRTSKLTNKAQIEEWAKDFGEDSDFFRVRVRGLPPRASDLQYIATDLVAAAQKREALAFDDDPLICGLDVARGGSAEAVFRFRRGFDARSIPRISVPGEKVRDSMVLVTLAADILGRTFDGRKVAMLFIDGTGIGGPICDRLVQLGHRERVMEIQFGGESPDRKFANMRSFMWGKCRDWLSKGAIDDSPRLESDLTGPGYHHDKQDRLVLESKEAMQKRGLASPDDGDGLALTFAAPVTTKRPLPKPPGSNRTPTPPRGAGGWMGS